MSVFYLNVIGFFQYKLTPEFPEFMFMLMDFRIVTVLNKEVIGSYSDFNSILT